MGRVNTERREIYCSTGPGPCSGCGSVNVVHPITCSAALVEVAGEALRRHGWCHEYESDAERDECTVCGPKDCPHEDFMHHHHDGCPSCDSAHPKTDRCAPYCNNDPKELAKRPMARPAIGKF